MTTRRVIGDLHELWRFEDRLAGDEVVLAQLREPLRLVRFERILRLGEPFVVQAELVRLDQCLVERLDRLFLERERLLLQLAS